MTNFLREAQATLRHVKDAAGDTRLSLQERYGTHEDYFAAVEKATGQARAAGFLLPEDAQALVEAARASAVLRQGLGRYARHTVGDAVASAFLGGVQCAIGAVQ